MSMSDEQWEFLQDVAWLIFYAKEMGYKLTGGDLYRSQMQHDYNLAHGLSKANRSKHQDRLAVDLNLFVDGKLVDDNTHEAWQKLGSYWEVLDPRNEWGGRWTSPKDPYHFQRNV